MPKFKYKALDTKGKPAAGEVVAADSRQAIARVRELGFFPTSVGELAEGATTKRGRIPQADIALAIRQLANLITAGLPMHRSLIVLAEQTYNQRLRKMIEEARADIRGGGSLSQAFGKFPKEFTPLMINLIRTGESTGSLGEALARLADLMDKSLQRRAQIVSALIYPALLIVVAIAAVAFLVTFLVPKLTLIFRDYETALPLPTVLLITVADAVRSGWWMGLLLIILLVGSMWYYSRRVGIAWWETLLRRLPISRRLLEKIVTARFSRTLGSLLAGGVSILEALAIAGAGTGSALINEAVLHSREEVREGVPLAKALEKVDGFMPVLTHVSAVGEETGKLSELLLRLSDLLDFEVDIGLRRLISVLEPAIILIMGIIVGFIVLAILLPIFNLGSVVGR